MLKQLAIFLYEISSPGHALLIAAIASWIGAILVELLRVEGEGKSGVVMLLRHYAHQHGSVQGLEPCSRRDTLCGSKRESICEVGSALSESQLCYHPHLANAAQKTAR
jgi:esterase/lipase superfamily enzyme